MYIPNSSIYCSLFCFLLRKKCVWRFVIVLRLRVAALTLLESREDYRLFPTYHSLSFRGEMRKNDDFTVKVHAAHLFRDFYANAEYPFLQCWFISKARLLSRCVFCLETLVIFFILFLAIFLISRGKSILLLLLEIFYYLNYEIITYNTF